MWADGRQQQSLPLDELEDQVSVHPLDGQLTVLIFSGLKHIIRKISGVIPPPLQTLSLISRMDKSSETLLSSEKLFYIYLKFEEAALQSLLVHHAVVVLLRLQDACVHLTVTDTKPSQQTGNISSLGFQS